jgi:hypothetical protein
MNAGPQRNDRLAFETIKNVLDSVLEHTELAVVVFAGGEPMGSRKTLYRAIRYCEDQGIATRMVSNAYWAKDAVRTVEVLRELRSAGLREVNISADDYHLPYVPFQNVANVWKSARGLGFKSVVIANGNGPESLINPGYLVEMLGDTPVRTWVDYRGQMVEFDLEPGTYYAISQTPVQRLERAGEELAATTFVPAAKQENLRGRCPHVIRDAALSPRGHLLSCCGFELDGNPILDLGDAKATDAWQLIEQANHDGVLTAIGYLGPYFLKGVIEQIAPGTIGDRCHGSVCELCRTIVTNPAAIAALQQAKDVLLPALAEARKIVDSQIASANEGTRNLT